MSGPQVCAGHFLVETEPGSVVPGSQLSASGSVKTWADLAFLEYSCGMGILMSSEIQRELHTSSQRFLPSSQRCTDALGVVRGLQGPSELLVLRQFEQAWQPNSGLSPSLLSRVSQVRRPLQGPPHPHLVQSSHLCGSTDPPAGLSVQAVLPPPCCLAPPVMPMSIVPQESEKLESVNAELKAQIEELKNEKQHLIYMLNLHRPTCIVRAQNGRTPEDERNLFIQQIKEGALQS